MFVGREEELQELGKLKGKKGASLVALNGRRRIGKSALIEEFGKQFPAFFEFQGLAPRPGVSAQDQLQNFSEQFSQNFKLPRVQFRDWTEAFAHLAERVSNKAALLFLDEISWMAGDDPDFAGKLKIAWDTRFKRNPKLILALCGSVSSWMEKNILRDADFVGRVSLVLRVGELDLASCGRFWGSRAERISHFEKLKALSVTGGVPKYLEEIVPTESADENIRRLCFTRGGYLFEDFERIFNDVFSRRAKTYKSILQHLVLQRLSAEEIAKKIGVQQGGDLTDYLSDMELSGFLSRDYAYSPQGIRSKLSRYRIRDNYLRFYLKYVEPNRDKIEKGLFRLSSLESLTQWDAVCGFQFENVVLKELPRVVERLQLNQARILSASPFFQRETTRARACQIDLLISCKNSTHFVCEIKFRKEIGMEVIKEVEEKLKRFQVPRHNSKRPVLIYAGGLKHEVRDADFFDAIINVEEFFDHG